MSAWWRAHRFGAAYGLVLGASAALNTVFVLYSVELFASTSASGLTPAWFYAGQTAYLWVHTNTFGEHAPGLPGGTVHTRSVVRFLPFFAP